jgi:ribosomal protein L11 methylase PrmA
MLIKWRQEYFAPNDEAENDRLDMHHHMSTLLLAGNLHVAPINKNPQRILDVGCGTGIWSIEMGMSPLAHA